MRRLFQHKIADIENNPLQRLCPELPLIRGAETVLLLGGEVNVEYSPAVGAVICEIAEMNVVAPIDEVAAESGTAEVSLPRILVAPVEHAGVSVGGHRVLEAFSVVLPVGEIVLLTRAGMC